MFAIAAIVLFILDAIGINHDWLLPAGLACLAAHLLVGTWPFPAFRRD
jgi:hypothetical protein